MSRRPVSPALRAPVYHFTDTVHLPWIIASGELRPSRRMLTMGQTQFIWGTTCEEGDFTAQPFRSAIRPVEAQTLLELSGETAWRAGDLQLVRFTLNAADFLTWGEVVRMSDWEPAEVAAHIEGTERIFGEYDHDRWRLRYDPLPLSRVIRVETTSFADAETECWHLLDIAARGVLLRPNDPKRKGVKIGRRQLYSTPVGRLGELFFLPWSPPRRRTRDEILADAHARRPDRDDYDPDNDD